VEKRAWSKLGGDGFFQLPLVVFDHQQVTGPWFTIVWQTSRWQNMASPVTTSPGSTWQRLSTAAALASPTKLDKMEK